MSQSKPTSPTLKVAPEFSGRDSLTRVLKGNTASAQATPPAKSGDGASWLVLGVSALWQTAAENAARRNGVELSEWLRQTVHEAAAAEGVLPLD